MTILYKVLGAWIAFDGIVSMTYFAKIDGTLRNKQDQGIRILRTLIGLAFVILG
jgi:hypothetical protein